MSARLNVCGGAAASVCASAAAEWTAVSMMEQNAARRDAVPLVVRDFTAHDSGAAVGFAAVSYAHRPAHHRCGVAVRAAGDVDGAAHGGGGVKGAGGEDAGLTAH